MTGSTTGGRSSDVAGKSILNRAHHTLERVIPRSLLRIGPSSSLASCSQRYQQRFPREAASIKQQYGPDSIGVVVSSKATNEDGFNAEVRAHRHLLRRPHEKGVIDLVSGCYPQR
jgi:hypothetical protein